MALNNNNWTCDPSALTEILETLSNSQVPNTSLQASSYVKLQQYSRNPEFSYYLMTIISRTEYGPLLRPLSLLILKSLVKDMNLPVLTYLRHHLLQFINDTNPQFRSALSSLLVTIVQVHTLTSWPELLPCLITALQSENENGVLTAMNTLVKICEDASEMIVHGVNHPLNELVPIWIAFFACSNVILRKEALQCLFHIVIVLPNALIVNMDVFLNGLSVLTLDSNNEIRKIVCRCLVVLVEVGIHYLLPHLENIIAFILSANQDPDDAVALEACEFWSAFCEQPFFHELKDGLQGYLPQILPLLLSKMVHSEEDISNFEAEEEEQNENVPDRPEDIAPIFHKNKAIQGHGAEEIDEDDDEDDFGEWNLRKCSAAALDVLSNNFHDDLLPILLPHIQARMTSDTHWKIREGAILALGAIAEGCREGMEVHLPILFPFLMTFLSDPAPYIRSITCWTLSRYVDWAVSETTAFPPLCHHLLRCIVDVHKKVQEAACSAFCTLSEEAEMELIPYLEDILKTLAYASTKYQARNVLILYDAIGTVADVVGPALNTPTNIALLMPPLFEKWNTISNDNRQLFPLLECLTSVATALSTGFSPYAHTVISRCLVLIEKGLLENAVYDANPTDTNQIVPENEFIVVSLDLISGIVESTCEENVSSTSLSSSLLTSPLLTSPTFLNLLLSCGQHSDPEVRQSTLALIGDLSKTSLSILRPGLHPLLSCLLNNLDVRYTSVCNNATWAIGELAMALKTEMNPYVNDCLNRMIPMINDSTLPRNLQENVTITLGRLACFLASNMTSHIPKYLQRWCLVMRDISDDNDRQDVFTGLCCIVSADPSACMSHFMFIAGAMTSWTTPIPTELNQTMGTILHGFKRSFGDKWTGYYSTFPPSLRELLKNRYALV